MTGVSRREFLKIGIAASGAVWLGLENQDVAHAQSAPSPSVLNPWVKLDSDGSVTVVIDKSEMGQGVVVGLAMLVAEEMDVPWERIRTEFAPAAPHFKNRKYGIQTTGGSTSLSSSWEHLRRMGATARAALIYAAAQRWGVAFESCGTQSGWVIHNETNKRLAYGELLADAALAPLRDVPLKDPALFRLIGKSVARPDVPGKVRGLALYGIDTRLTGMRYATVIHAPVFGAELETLDARAALAMPGVRDIFDIGGAVAVVADSTWQAMRASAAVVCTWRGGDTADLNSVELTTRWAALAAQEGDDVRDEGKTLAVLERNDIKRVHAIYELPYLAHATMEPMNCTADARPDRCDVWVPTQAQSLSQAVAARICGLAREQVFINTTFLGGGFGRRGQADFVAQAVTISKRIGAPVQLVWSREQDMQHDFYRPASYHVMRAAINKHGLVEAWFHRLVCPPILARVIEGAVSTRLPEWLPDSWQDGLGWLAGRMMGMRADPTAIAGAVDQPYDIPNIRVEYVEDDPGVPVGMWRSVGNSHNGFVVESFADEIAQAQNQDPYEFRRKLLKKKLRHLHVLESLVDRSGWKLPKRDGIGRGMAVHESFGTIVGQVAEVARDGDRWRVVRVVCVVDCGRVVHPDSVAAQMEGGILFGLSAALHGEIRIEQGRVPQSNFHDYPVCRLNEAPVVEVYIMPSDEAPSGVGEPGVPPLAAAVANAMFDATRKRQRKLPLDMSFSKN